MVERHLEERWSALAPQPERLAVAVSGGVDSMTLLYGLHAALRGRVQLIVLHVDHGLRPCSASDAEFVRRSAASLGLAVHIEPIRVRGSGQHHARFQRYAALGRAAARAGATMLAVAHHADDDLEGRQIAAHRDTRWAPMRERSRFEFAGVEVWRPLLGLTRADLLTFMDARSLSWREDPTNQRSDYLRNAIRHGTLVPAASPRTTETAEASRRVRLERPTPWSAACSRSTLTAETLRALFLAVDGAVPPSAGLDELVAWIASGGRGRRSARRATVEAGRHTVVVERSWSQGTRSLDARHAHPVFVDLRHAPEGSLWFFGWQIRWRGHQGVLEIRGPRPGDRMHIDAGTRRIVDSLRQQGVERWERWRAPVVVFESAIVAVGQESCSRTAGPSSLPELFIRAPGNSSVPSPVF